MEHDVFARPAFWLATAMPFVAAAAVFIATYRMRLLWRGMLLALVHFVTLPAGFVLVLEAIDRGPELRRPVDGLATIPVLGVWSATLVLLIVVLGLLNERTGQQKA
jgi:hypothetical protein